MTNIHIPVLLDPILENIDFSNHPIVFDGTYGGGGYTKSFLEKGSNVFACDLDDSVKPLNHDNLQFSNSSYHEYIKQFDDNFFDCIVLDLGFSSNQLTDSGRGFSYQNDDEIFDLRYKPTNEFAPAWKLACGKPVENLWKTFYTLSGEKFSRNAAHAVKNFTKTLQKDESFTVGQIKSIIVDSIPLKYKKNKNAILSRIWQAMRIEVNREFENIENFLPISLEKLKPGGKLMIVCFHSLEDKIVTKFMRDVSRPIEIDDYGNKQQNYKLLTKKPIKPTEEEITQNIRSRSATLRILQKS